ncbi:hypothetical protein CsatB_015486 [Cannabis sativa]
MEMVTRMVSDSPLVIFSRSSCCMCHSIKSLFYSFGANPTVYELDKIPIESSSIRAIEQALTLLGCSPTLPAIFIGGQFIGGAQEVIRLHLSGTKLSSFEEISDIKD